MSYSPNAAQTLTRLRQDQQANEVEQESYQTLEDHNSEKFLISKLDISNIKRVKKYAINPIPSIKTMVANGSCIAIGTTDDTIIFIRLGSTPEEYELRRSETILKLFLDPSGNHLFISTEQGSFIYFSPDTKRFIDIKSKIFVEAVGFNQHSCEQTTYPFLFGTRDGVLFECTIENGKEKGTKELYTMDKRRFISGIAIEYIQQESGSYYYILVTTSSTTCYYEFYGGNTFEECFKIYQNKKNRDFCDLPSGLPYTQLCTYHPSSSDYITSFSILLESGAYYGTLDFSTSIQEKKVKNCLTCPNDATEGENKKLMALALSQFHFVFLYSKSLTIKNALTFDTVYKKNIYEHILGLCQDDKDHLIWLYTDYNIYELTIKNEDEDIWKLYLNKAQNPDEQAYFDVALQYVHSEEDREIVMRSKAEHYFKQGLFDEAAELFAQTTYSLEDISLRFMDANQKHSLLIYLTAKEGYYTEPIYHAQKVLLCTWITEIYLDLLNDYGVVDPNNESEEYSDLIFQFNSFLQMKVKYLDEKTTYQLLLSHGRVNEMLEYAKLIKDYDRVLAYYIQKQDYQSALYILQNLTASDNKEQLYYKYAPSLLIAAPEETVDTWCSIKYLDPCKFIPALVRYMLNRQLHPTEEKNQAIRYLEYLVENGNQEVAIHNYLIYLYAHENYDNELIQYLNDAEENQYFYDKKYALRICLQEHKDSACIFLYRIQDMYDEAIQLALTLDIESAKTIANQPQDVEIQKRLWLIIIKYVIQKSQDTTMAIQLLNECPLKIEDILPFFPNFTSIDDFREPITKSLGEYNEQIQEMKDTMNKHTECAKKIRQDINHLNTRYATINGDKRCECCHEPIVTRTFYLFPCTHVFHEDCLKNERQKRLDLLKKLDDDNYKYEQNKDIKLDQECPLCGNLMIDSISVPIAPAFEGDKQWSFDLDK